MLLDTTWASSQGGTARYVRSMLDALNDEVDVEVIAVRAPRLTRVPRTARLPLNGVAHLLWTQIALPLLALCHRADIVSCSMMAPVFCPRPIALTLHDALDFLPDVRPSRMWSAYMRTIGALAARRADVVLTGTQASSGEIVRYYRLDSRRVRVTPYGSALLGNDDGAHDGRALSEPTGGHPFVLMVGSADARKDIGTGLRAVASIRQSGVELCAVVVGSVPSAFAGRAWVRVVGNVSDSELARLYASALAVLVPSRHEGYGLPVIEALAFGTPVVASDIPALREVGGAAARYAATGDVDGFARELARIVERPDIERERLTAAARTLTWRATARTTTAIFRALVQCG